MKVDIFNADKKYNIIYADPPWNFKYYSKKGEKHKIELFARQYADGWDCWGNEV